MKTILPLVSLTALFALTATAQTNQSDYVPMKVIQTEEVVYPRQTTALGITSGEARVAVQVDEHGALTDSLLTAATHPAFGERALSAVKRWKYEPAWIKGSPRSATLELTFNFKTEGIVLVDMTVSSFVEQRMYQLMSGAYRYHACALRELDRIPTPKKIVKPIYPVEMAKSGHHGRVVVDFYIDESGRVRMPAVSLETTRNDEELATAAVTAVSQWEFEPPVSHGRPALVAIQQEFNFQGKD